MLALTARMGNDALEGTDNAPCDWSSMSTRETTIDVLAIDPQQLTRSAVKGLRAAFGVSGAVALILGTVLLFWPAKTLAAVAIFLGINFLITGGIKVGVGIFGHSLSAGTRILDILLGALILGAGVISLRNSTATGELLLLFTVVMMGIGWIFEGIIAMAEAGRGRHRLWPLVFGIISVIAGIVVLVVPGWTAGLLLMTSAIMLIVLGIVGLVRAFTFGKSALQ